MTGPETLTAQIDAHLAGILGPCSNVLTEILPPAEPHIGVARYPAQPDLPVTTYVTRGLASDPMAVPIDNASPAHAELVMAMPTPLADEMETLSDQATIAPLNLLRWLARFPSAAHTFFAEGHTVPLPDDFPLGPLKRFAAILLAVPLTWPREAVRLTTPSGEVVSFLGVYPLLPDEAQAAQNDVNAVFRKMWEQGVPEVFIPDRGSVI